MGYSSPQKIGYDVYLANDNSLQKDAAVYSTGAGTEPGKCWG